MLKESENISNVPRKFVGPSKHVKGFTLKDIEPPKMKWYRKCCRYMYNRDKKTFCGRTCCSWFKIVSYSIIYLLFLSTFTIMFLYGSLLIIKSTEDFQMIERTEFFTYSENGIGLSATPTSVNNQPLIWYRDDPRMYQKYIDSLEVLVNRRKKRDISDRAYLGPCGSAPFGYGKKPCVIIRINKRLKWSASPLKPNSSDIEHIPKQVRDWVNTKKPKLWLHCHGSNHHDEEHIGTIKYYPDPPGFDSEIFPIDMTSDSPLVAVQISSFTLGMSLAMQCNLWFEGGTSTFEFVLYVTPKKKAFSNL